MIVIHVQVQIKPEKRVTFFDVAQQDVARAKTFPGCVRYEWMADIASASTFTLYEEWETQSDFDGYKQSDELKKLNEVFAPLMSAAPSSQYYAAELLPV